MYERGSAPWWLSVVTLIVGLGAGYMLWGEDAASPTEVDGGLDEAAGPSDTATALRGADGMTPSGATLEAGSAVDPLTRILRAEPAPELVRGSGRLSGRVVDSAGQPVPGVRMKIQAEANHQRFYPTTYDPDPEKELLQRLRGMIASDRWQRAYRRVTTTAADGTYAFEELPDVSYRVSGELEGWNIRPENHQHWRGVSIGTEVPFQARAQGRFTFQFSEAPPASLNVTLKQQNATRQFHWSPADRFLSADPGVYDLSVSGGPSETLRAGPIPIELKPGAEPLVIPLTFTRSPVLRLTISAPPGEGLPVQVWYLKVADGERPSEAVLKARGTEDHNWGSHRRNAGSDTTRTLKDLEVGTYAIGVARGDEDGLATIELVDLVPGIVEHTIELPPLDPASYVILGVYDADGKPLPSPRITTGWFGERGSRSGGSSTAPRPDGRILVMHQQPNDSTADGTWWVEARVEGHGAKRVAYKAGKARELELRFEAPASVDVEVKGVAGTPYEGRVSVRLVADDGTRTWGGDGTPVDGKGQATVRGIQPGPYRLELTVKAGRHRRMATVASEPFTVRAGTQARRIDFPTLHTVTVHGAKGTAICRREGERKPGHSPLQESHWGEADSNGDVVFDTLRPGSYSVQSGRKQATFRVPGTREVTLEAPKR